MKSASIGALCSLTASLYVLQCIISNCPMADNIFLIKLKWSLEGLHSIYYIHDMIDDFSKYSQITDRFFGSFRY